MEVIQAGAGNTGKRSGEIKPGRVGGKNSEYRSGNNFIHKKLKNEIEEVLQKHRDRAAHKDKIVGAGTQEKRETVIRGFFSDLLSLGYKIESVENLKQKHLNAVFRMLEEKRQSPATIQNKISIMRVFCEWIGKKGMVRDSSLYVKDTRSVRRSMVATEDKSWDGKGINVLEKLPEIAKKDKWVAICLELCWAFGLRKQESVMFRPSVSHEGNFISVRDGTKGDRPRFVPIENDVQRDVLKRAQLMADGKNDFLGKRGKTPKQKINRFNYVMSCCGLTLSEKGVTAHGLRHQYMQESFERLTGVKAPVKGGDLNNVDKRVFHLVSQKMMERAGHTRVSIGAAYYGSRRVKTANPEQSGNQVIPDGDE